jgi:glycine dehydrogenase
MNIFNLQQDEFLQRHIGPNEKETNEMLAVIGINSVDELISKTIPQSIRSVSYTHLRAHETG